jgi:hypothetical protein
VFPRCPPHPQLVPGPHAQSPPDAEFPAIYQGEQRSVWLLNVGAPLAFPRRAPHKEETGAEGAEVIVSGKT